MKTSDSYEVSSKYTLSHLKRGPALIQERVFEHVHLVQDSSLTHSPCGGVVLMKTLRGAAVTLGDVTA